MEEQEFEVQVAVVFSVMATSAELAEQYVAGTLRELVYRDGAMVEDFEIRSVVEVN